MLKKNKLDLPPSLIQTYHDFLLTAIAHIKLEDKKDYIQTSNSYKDLNSSELTIDKIVETEKNIDELLYNKTIKTIKNNIIIKSNKKKTHIKKKKT